MDQRTLQKMYSGLRIFICLVSCFAGETKGLSGIMEVMAGQTNVVKLDMDRTIQFAFNVSSAQNLELTIDGLSRWIHAIDVAHSIVNVTFTRIHFTGMSNGNYLVKPILYNLHNGISQGITGPNIVVIYEDRIQISSVHLSSQVGFVKETMTAEVAFSKGSNIAVEWWVSHGFNACFHLHKYETDRPMLRFSFQKEGKENLYVMASNGIGNVAISLNLTIKALSEKIRVIPKQNINAIRRPVIFQIITTKQWSAPVDISINFGDGSNRPIVSCQNNKTITHLYGEEGAYNISFSVTYDTGELWQSDEVSTIQVLSEPNVSLNSSLDNVFYGHPDIFMVISILHDVLHEYDFTIVVDNVTKFNGTQDGPNIFHFKRHTVGVSLMTLRVTSTSGDSVSYYTIFTDYDIENELIVSSFNNKVMIPPGELSVTLNLRKTVRDQNKRQVECHIDQRNLGTYNITYANSVQIKTYFHEGAVESTFNLTCYNLGFKFEFLGNISVIPNPCSGLNIAVNSSRRIVALSESNILIRSKIKLQCDLCSSVPRYQWKIIPSESVLHTNSNTINLCSFPGKCLPGERHVTVNITLEGCQFPFPNSTFSAEILRSSLWAMETFIIQIAMPPLMAFIEGGMVIHQIPDRWKAYPRWKVGDDSSLNFTWKVKYSALQKINNVVEISNVTSSSLPVRKIRHLKDVRLIKVCISYKSSASCFRQKIEILDGAIQRKIICLTNCLNKLSVSKGVLEIACYDCSDFNINASWLRPQMIVQKSWQHVSLNVSLIQTETKVRLYDGKHIISSWWIPERNEKPHSGRCISEQINGTELTDSFTFACFDWVDDGNIYQNSLRTSASFPSPLYYRFLLADWYAKDSKKPVLLYEGWEARTPPIQLPHGRKENEYVVQIRAEIVDLYRDSGQSTINVTVHPLKVTETLFEKVDDILKRNMSFVYVSQLHTLQTLVVILKDISSKVEEFFCSPRSSVNASNDGVKKYANLQGQTSLRVKKITTILKNILSKSKYLYQSDYFLVTSLLSSLGSFPMIDDITSASNVLNSLDMMTDFMKKLHTTMPNSEKTDKERLITEITQGNIDVLDAVLDAATSKFGHKAFKNNLLVEDIHVGLPSNIYTETYGLKKKFITAKSSIILKILNQNADFLANNVSNCTPSRKISIGYITQMAIKVNETGINNISVSLNNMELSLSGCHLRNRRNDSHVFVVSEVNNPALASGNGSSYISSSIVMTHFPGTFNCTMQTRSSHNQKIHSSIHPIRLGDQGNIIHFMFKVQSTEDAVIIYLQLAGIPTGENAHYVAYIGRYTYPTTTHYDMRFLLHKMYQASERYKLFIPAGELKKGYGYLGLSLSHHDGQRSRRHKRAGEPLYSNSRTSYRVHSMQIPYPFHTFTHSPFSTVSPKISTVCATSPIHTLHNDIKPTVSIVVTSQGCRMLNSARIWTSNGCKVLKQSTLNFTICRCPHNTRSIVATSFFVAPAPIPFMNLIEDFDIGNASVYGTIIGLFCMYSIAILFLRREDKKDLNVRWSTYFLCDSDSNDNYFYLVTVYTGMRRGAGTKSNVRFVLSGEEEDSGVRMLSDGVRDGFDTGSIRRFFMGTPITLGDLIYLRIWHDNSGTGNQKSWYLKKVTVEDLQTKHCYTFSCEKWLAADFSDGKVDRIIPTSSFEDLPYPSRFSELAQYNVSENHVWLSLMMRPQRSHFTRVQRMTCAFCLLLLTMLANAAFYNARDGPASGSLVQIGSLRFSMTDVYISVISILLTTPIIFLISYLFRKSKKGNRFQSINRETNKLHKLLIENTRLDLPISCDHLYMTEILPLPPFVRYIAWALLCLTIIFSTLALIAYSMAWKRKLSEEWLASFALSFVESVFIVDPIKILLLAAVLAFLLKTNNSKSAPKVDLTQVKAVSSTFDNLSDSRALMYMNRYMFTCYLFTRTRSYFKIYQHDRDSALRMELLSKDEPPRNTVLQQSRIRHKQEMKAQRIFFELLLYTAYTIIVYMISYIGRDQRSFNMKNNIENTLLIGPNSHFYKVNTSTDYVDWMTDVFVPNFYPYNDCRGHPTENVYFSDCTNIRMGPARLRQVRMASGKCSTSLLHSSHSCINNYDMLEEMKSDYCPGWTVYYDGNCSTRNHDVIDPSSWLYNSANTLHSSLFIGQYDTYGGGGYVLTFPPTRSASFNLANHLLSTNWIDRHTRAILLEFTLYNPNINLFTCCMIIAEFPEIGSVFHWTNIHVFRPEVFIGSTGTLAIICYFIFCSSLVVSTVKILKQCSRAPCKFFRTPWNMVDFFNIVLSYVLVVLFIIRMVFAKSIMDEYIPLLIDNKFTNFQTIVALDFALECSLGILVFIVTLRILKILGYNKRLTEIISVITHASKDIAGFGIVFGVIFSAYVLLGFLLFGSTRSEYKSVFTSFGTLTNSLIGKNKLDILLRTLPGIAQMYYFSYNFCVLWTIMTMFSAILNRSIEEVRASMKQKPRVYGVFDMITNSIRNLFGGLFYVSSKNRNDSDTHRVSNIKSTKFNARNILQLVRDILVKHSPNINANRTEENRNRNNEGVHTTSTELPLLIMTRNKKYLSSDSQCSGLPQGRAESNIRRRKSMSRAGTLRDIDLIIGNNTSIHGVESIRK